MDLQPHPELRLGHHLFTIVIRLLSIPLQLNQQKSMAKMSAFQPMIADIQKKYKDKPEKQQKS